MQVEFACEDLKMAKANSSHKARSDFVDRHVREGKWKPQVIPAGVVGLSRDLTVFRTARSSNIIDHKRHGDDETYCPSVWSDLAIGSGPCGLQCRQCFLMLTTARVGACNVAHAVRMKLRFCSAVCNCVGKSVR